MVGVPVIINHKDITAKNADDERVGVVNSVWYDDKDGWYWCDGIIWDETAQNLITDQNWSVSCSYDVKTANDEGGSENNIKYDMEFLDGVFTHLALVNNPRYERANIVFNSKTEIVNDKWITIHPNGEDNKGRHLLLKDGETPKEAVERKVAEWKEKKVERPFKSKDGGKIKDAEYKGCDVSIQPDGKYADIRIYAPEGKTFPNGDTFYTTQALTEKAEEHAKKLIDGITERDEWRGKKEDKTKRREIEHNGAKILIIPDGKYSDIKIDAPEGKTFKNGDTWYSTQALTEKAEEHAKRIIEGEFGQAKKEGNAKNSLDSIINNALTEVIIENCLGEF